MQIKPKKRLGQNFLIDQNIRRKIIDNCLLTSQDTVLEIGAGTGEMTGLICKESGAVYSLEIDRSLIKFLEANLENYGNVKIINQDVLKFNFDGFFKTIKGRLKVIGNIPYYITTPIVERLLEHRVKIDSIFITVQKEFAKRIVALPGSKEYGSLSCFLQYYTEPKIVFSINKKCFKPAPKVDSCLLRLLIREKPPVFVKDEKEFFLIIRTAFNQRRKILRNSLKNIISAESLNRFFYENNINSNIRPECLSLQNFACLANS